MERPSMLPSPRPQQVGLSREVAAYIDISASLLDKMAKERTPKPSKLPLSLPPTRGLNRVQAAGYIGVSPSKFDELVADGRMPKPKRIDARTLWDRLQLDEAFDALPYDGAEGEANPWDNAWW